MQTGVCLAGAASGGGVTSLDLTKWLSSHWQQQLGVTQKSKHIWTMNDDVENSPESS